jgi:hypothetical protein
MASAGIRLLNLFDKYGQLSPNEKKKFGEQRVKEYKMKLEKNIKV